MWGWSIEKSEAFSILDYFYDQGERCIDAANNYPISGNQLDYQKSALFIGEWCRTRRVNDLRITFKVGSVTNTNTPVNNLSQDNLIAQYNWSRECFSENLSCIMIHWDDRDDENAIDETCQTLQKLHRDGIDIGLSGIKNPQLYSKFLMAKEMANINIQVKNNFLFSGLGNYTALEELKPRYWAYGISVSGLKLSEEEYNKNSYVRLTKEEGYHKNMLAEKTRVILLRIIKDNNFFNNLYHVAIAFSEKEELLHGYMIAPSSLEQMEDIIRFRNLVDFQGIVLPEINAS